MNQRCKNFFQHIIRSLQHFVIPEPDHSKSAASQVLRPLDVVQQIIRVLTAVDFDDETRTDTHEVDDISTDRLLPSKSVISKMSVAQVPPKAAFGFG